MYHTIVRFLNKGTAALTMVFLVLMVLLVFMQIVVRIVTGTAFSWTEELARYLMIWMAFLGGGFAFQRGAHMSIEVLVTRFSHSIQKVLKVISLLLCVVFYGLLFIKGIEWVGNSASTSPGLQIPMAYVYLAIPIGAFLQLINVIDVTWQALKKGS